MKKRVLALLLAITTMWSMLGTAMPIYAGDPEEGTAQTSSPVTVTIKKSVELTDGSRYTVSVTFDGDALPLNTELAVIALSPAPDAPEDGERPEPESPDERYLSEAEWTARRDAAAEALEAEDSYVFFTGLLDIALTADGSPIRPTKPVTVTVETDAVDVRASDSVLLAGLTAADGEQKADALKLENVSDEPSGDEATRDFARFSYETEELSAICLMGAADELCSFSSDGVAVSVFGPRGLKAEVREQSAEAEAEGRSLVAAFSVLVQSDADHDVALWLKTEGGNSVGGYALASGTAEETILPGGDEPALILAGEAVALLQDAPVRAPLKAPAASPKGADGKPALIITADSAEREYDGTALTQNTYTVSGTLSEGHRIVSVAVSPERELIDAGNCYNIASDAVIYDLADADVTDEYAVTYRPGTLTVAPKGVTLTANSATLSFIPGEEQIVTGYTCSEPGVVFEGVSASGSGTQPGMYVVALSGATVNETRDATGNYIVTGTADGLLIIADLDRPLIGKRLVDFHGDIASYEVTVNPDGLILNGGDPIVVKDTFGSNQSINYGTIWAACNSAETVSYDYSGNTGTFTVPDGAAVTITYDTRVKGNAGEDATFTNTAVLGKMEGWSFVGGPEATVEEIRTVTPGGTDITGTDGVYTIRLFTYAQNHMEQGLGGAVFRLLDSNMQPMHYASGSRAGQIITFTTGDDGYVTVQLSEETDGVSIRKNTAYYLEMVTAPYQFRDGEYTYYQKDNTYYSFLITDDPDYTYGGIYAYFNGDVLKVRCYPESRGINVTKRFSGNYELTNAQKNAIRFLLQKETPGGDEDWETVEVHTYAEFSYGSMNFLTGRAGGTELQGNATYRVIEENVLPAELEGVIDENVAVTVTYQENGLPVEEDSNEFFIDPHDSKTHSYNLAFTNEYVDHKLTVVKLDENTGSYLSGAEFTVYAAGNDEDPVAVYTTDGKGALTIRRGDAAAGYRPDTLYYVVETAAPENYILPALPEKVYFYFSGSSADVPFGLPAGAEATDLTTSYNTVTIANSSTAVDVPVTVVWGAKGNEPWPDSVDHVVIGLYRSVDGAEPEAVKDAQNQPRTVTLTKEQYYNTASFVRLPAQTTDGKRIVYSVDETGIYDAADTDISGQFAHHSSVSGTGWYVVTNQAAVSVKLQKEWYDLDGETPIGDTSAKSPVTVDLYRTTATSDEERFTREALEELLGDAEPVRTGIELSAANGWTATVDSLEITDPRENTYYYYALETVPDNQEDSYVVAPAEGSAPRTLTIRNRQTPITVTIRATDLEKTYGDDDPAFDFEAGVMLEGATVAVSGPDGEGVYTAVVTAPDDSTETITFTAEREAGEDVGEYEITPAGEALQGGYRVLLRTGTLTIRPAEVTITAGAEKFYGDADPALVTIVGMKNGEDPDEVLRYSVSREEGEDVGEYPITLIGDTEQGNYTVTFVRRDEEDRPYTFIIKRAHATVKAEDASKLYGEEDPGFAASVTGLKNDDEATVISFELTRDPGEDVGEYVITPSGEAEQGNYTVSFETGTFTITTAAVSISLESAEKTYGDPDPVWEVTIDGLQGTDDVGTLSSVLNEETGVRTYTYTVTKGEETTTLLTFTASRPAGEDIGEYPVTLTGDAAQGNYTVAYTSGKLTIVPAEVSVVANDLVKAVGAADPLLTATVEGLKNGDEEIEPTHTQDGDTITWSYVRGTGEDAVTVLTFTLRRDAGEDEGEYHIAAAGAKNQGNYTVYYDPGTFNILSVLDIDVSQPLVDDADRTANPSYSYTATLDLAGTGLSEYSKNGFENVEGVPTLSFTLPEDGSNIKMLKVPAGAKLTVAQTSTNPDYVTTVGIDGSPLVPAESERCVIESIDTYHDISFTHSRISYPVEARAAQTAAGDTETGATPLVGRKTAIGIPETDSRAVDADFADVMHSLIGFTLPAGSYYMYDHASLYTDDGPVAGATGVTAMRYAGGVWQYSVDGESFTDAPENSKLVLFYLPKFVCRIGTEKFYTLNAAVAYAGANLGGSATIEMLIGEYSLRSASDAVTIPADYTITITTADDEEYEGESGVPAVISRSQNFTDGSLFSVRGSLTFDGVTVSGKQISASAPMVNTLTDAAVLHIGPDAELTGANGAGGGAIYVTRGTVTVDGALTDNRAASGGAVYVAAGTVTFAAGARLTGNSADYGGAVHVNGGTVALNSASVTGNRATYGGAISVAGGVVTVGGTIGSETDADANTAAASGGAVYMTGGTLTVNGAIKHNRAPLGGGVYQSGGTMTVGGSAALEGNGAGTNGGAVYLAGGTLNLSGGTLSDNSAGNYGGAVYTVGGTLNATGSTLSGNSAVSGGAIYSESAKITVSGGSLTGNTASTGDGGAIYAAGGTVTVSGGSLSGNTAASGRGGAVYTGSGTVTHTGGAITGNSAVNGAAIFVGTGIANISAAITGNTASSGGAVGVGASTARLYFSGNAQVTGNTMDGQPSNVYLNQDIELVVNVNGKLNSAGQRIGVYVPGDVNGTLVVNRGDVGGFFGAYTVDTNIESVFKNDRFPELDAKIENNRIYWGAKLLFDVVYKKAFDADEPPKPGFNYNTTGGGSYMKVTLGQISYPRNGENNRYDIYDLVTSLDLYNKYTADFNARAGSATAGAASVYAYTYAGGTANKFDAGLQFSDFLSRVEWDNVNRKWVFVKQDGTEAEVVGTNLRIIIIYTAPTYISITNNNELGLPLRISPLMVNGRDTAATHYGYATAKNGATVETLKPLDSDDLYLQAGESVKLLFPGSRNTNYVLNGTFEGATDETTITYKINEGEEQTSVGQTLTLSGRKLPNDNSTEEIVIGEPLPICRLYRVEDGASTEIGNGYPRLTQARDAMTADSAANGNHKVYRIEMLVDYLIPADDVLNIPGTYQVTFTTEPDFDVDGRRQAILSRDFGNSGSSVILKAANAATNSALTVDKLIFDGRAIAGSGNGGAVYAEFATVTVTDSQFKGYRATRGGAVYVDFKNGGSLTVTDTDFVNCHTDASEDKAGGGAIWTTAKALTVENCSFDNCSCTAGRAQAGAIFHNIQNNWSTGTTTVVRDCTFETCYCFGGSAGTIESDALDVTIERCSFTGSVTNKNGGNGGAINLYINNEAETAKDCIARIIDCEFHGCKAEKGTSNGGAIRSTSKVMIVTGCKFYDSISATGGAISMTNSKADRLEMANNYFENCQTSTGNGGAINSPAKVVIVDGDTYYNCTAHKSGGGLYLSSNNASGSVTLTNCVFDTCTARTEHGGGVFTPTFKLAIGGADTAFISCSAKLNGGAVNHNPNGTNSSFSLTGGAFTDCEALGSSGGAVISAARIVAISDCSVSGSRATSTGGGIYINPSTTVNVERVTMSGNYVTNNDSKGGGIFFGSNNYTANVIDANISDCRAALGGGIYKSDNGSGRLNVTGGSVHGIAATSGGGIYLPQGTLAVENAAVSGEAVNGGGIYVNGGTLNLTGATVSGTASGNGGGIWSKSTVNHTSGDVSGTATNGGGVYVQTGGKYNFTAGTITGTASENGGAVYVLGDTFVFAGGTVGRSGDVTSSAKNGGAMYVAGGTVSFYNEASRITGGTASEGGGGLYVAGGTFNMGSFNGNNTALANPGGSIIGNSAKNGGGVYVAGGTFNQRDGAVAQNSASASGGGVYHARGTLNFNGGTIGGSEENANTAEKGGGVFVADGQTANFNDWVSKALQISYNNAAAEGGGIAVGGPGAVLMFQNTVTVRHNTMGSGNTECNVYLDQDSNTVIRNGVISNLSYIGVYASDAQDGEHGDSGMHFGTRNNATNTDANLNAYHNDRRPYLYGVRGEDYLVDWAFFVCKITDAEGNLLYMDTDGTPAVYVAVENDVAGGAFKTLNVAGTPALYTKDAAEGDAPYTGAYQVQMLVESYGLTKQIQLQNNKTVTITTASATADECGFAYAGRNPIATLKRQANYSGVIWQTSGDLTIRNLTLDGNKAGGYQSVSNGGLWCVEGSSATANIGPGATLCNSATATGNTLGGAGVFVKGNAALTIDGGVIRDCVSARGNGGGILLESGTVSMYSGSITGCSAVRGGGVYLTGGSFYMYSGAVTDNSAVSYNGSGTDTAGGGIGVGNSGARLYFGKGETDANGHCTVANNTMNGVRCNVELDHNTNAIINANGLNSASEIGVFTTDANGIHAGHGVESKPFGTWTIDDDKVFCFVNDRHVNLRGYRSIAEDDHNMYWEYHPMIRLAKTVDSDWSQDRNVEFVFTVQLDMELGSIRNDYGEMSFDRHGKATVRLKAGEAKTGIFPDDFDGTAFTVTEELTEEQTADYNATVQKDGADYAFTGTARTVAGRLGENISGDETSTSLSDVVFTNTRVTGDLTVSKTVETSKPADLAEEFSFVVKLSDTTISKEYATEKTIIVNNDTTLHESGTLRFTGGQSEPFTLKHGESLKIRDLPTDIPYTVTEKLTTQQATKIRTTIRQNGGSEVSALSVSGTIAPANNTAAFTNNFLDIVCKITNRNRELLYYREANGTLQPAIYSHLEDAFDQINLGNLRTATNGTVSGALRIEMVVPEYTMEHTATLNSGKTVILSTALTGDAQYPYNGGVDDGSGNVSTVSRGFASGSMIADSGALTLDKITLDGDSTRYPAANASGGIVSVNGPVRLNVNSGATLRNSAVTGTGGAINLPEGASLAMNGTIENCAASNGGGIFADNGFTTLTTTGTISGCTATNDGGAICALNGSSVSLNAGTELFGNSALKGNGGAVYSATGVILRGDVGGTETGRGNSAKNEGGGVYMAGNAMFTMYAGSSISGNSASNGGGLATGAAARIAGGSFEKNRADELGGAVYAGAGASVAISGVPAFTGNSAKRGGAVYDGASVSMTGGTMTGNTATETGAAVYAAAGKDFTMSGGSITGNRSPEGAVSTGEAAVLNLSGNTVITGNTDTDGTTVKNVYLGFDSNSIIRTAGLGVGAAIGVYVADGDPEPDSVLNPVSNPIYSNHGVGGRNFGTYTGSNISGARLSKFTNDRDSALSGMSGAAIPDSGGQYFVMWNGKGLKILVHKLEKDGTAAVTGNVSFRFVNSAGETVWTGKSGNDGFVLIPWGGSETDGGDMASFMPGSTYTLEETAANSETVRPAGRWTVTVGRDSSITWATVASEAEHNRTHDVEAPAEKAYLGDTFKLYNDVRPKLTYNANGNGGGGDNDAKLADKNSVRTDTIGFTAEETSHTYTINEPNPVWDSHVFQSWATLPEKPEGDDPAALGYIEYHKGDTIPFFRGTDDDDMTLYAQWKAVVCKITDRNGELLYVNGNPAVYGTLEDGFASFDTSVFTTKSGGRATPRRIEMLIGDYTLNETVTLQTGKTAILTTAPETDTDGYAYTGAPGSVCTIHRGDDCGTMIVNNANLTFLNITLDGENKPGRIAENSIDYAILTVNHGSTLRNASVEGDGGAIYVGEKSTLEIHDGTITGNSATGSGGAICSAENGTVSVSGGTFSANTAASGAGIYLPAGSTLNLSGAPGFYGNTAATALPAGAQNGGTAYTAPRQDIFLAEAQADPASIRVTGNLTGGAGSIWVWADDPSHYLMLKPFATVADGVSLNDNSYLAFRNARPDSETLCGGSPYLTGRKGDNAAWIYWTGGFDVRFEKIDGFGQPQSGAVFQMFTDPACRVPYLRNGEAVTAASADGSDPALPKGTVLFDKLPVGTYYMKEITAPTGYVNSIWADNAGSAIPNVYIVLVGETAMAAVGGAGVLSGITAANISDQTARYTAAYGLKDYAIFLIDGDPASAARGKAVTTPNIAKYGVMNLSTLVRRVILRKVNSTYDPLNGAKFDIFRYDGTRVAENCVSGASGCFWIGSLPCGEYYLHETQAPSGYTGNKWFTFRVNDTDAPGTREGIQLKESDPDTVPR